jgi:hypothetical protein
MKLVVDLGYYNGKTIDEDKRITIIKNAYVNAAEGETSIPLDQSTRKVTFQVIDPKYGIINSTRIYGEKVCQMASSIQGIGSRKAEEVRFFFASLLSSKCHNKKIDVFYIHNEEKDFSMIEKSILGVYKVKINGEVISTEVVSCQFLLEGLGSYFELKKTHALSGSTRILDLGFGVANELIVNEQGEVEYFATKQDFSMFMLAKTMESSEIFQTHLGSYTSNLTSIAYALEKDRPLGSMTKEEWDKMKNYAISQYFKKLKNYLTSPNSNSSLFVNQYVLCGGGARILERENEAFKTAFLIPKDAATSSLIGILDHPKIKNGGRW